MTTGECYIIKTSVAHNISIYKACLNKKKTNKSSNFCLSGKAKMSGDISI